MTAGLEVVSYEASLVFDQTENRSRYHGDSLATLG
jgi:hypothetical protein